MRSCDVKFCEAWFHLMNNGRKVTLQINKKCFVLCCFHTCCHNLMKQYNKVFGKRRLSAKFRRCVSYSHCERWSSVACFAPSPSFWSAICDLDRSSEVWSADCILRPCINYVVPILAFTSNDFTTFPFFNSRKLKLTKFQVASGGMLFVTRFFNGHPPY